MRIFILKHFLLALSNVQRQPVVPKSNAHFEGQYTALDLLMYDLKRVKNYKFEYIRRLHYISVMYSLDLIRCDSVLQSLDIYQASP